MSSRNPGVILKSVGSEEKENMRTVVNQNIRMMKTIGVVPGEEKKTLYQLLTTPLSQIVSGSQ